MSVRFRVFAQTVIAMLREVFESAYQRFLVRRDMVSSSEAYSEFLQESEQVRARRLRCC